MVKRPAQDQQTRSLTQIPPNNMAPGSTSALASDREEKYLLSTYKARLRELAASRRYPDLLFGPLNNHAQPVYSNCRKASGLLSRVMQHGDLSSVQKQQLAEFRFHQYVLWDWFDTKTIIQQHIQIDPAFQSLPATTLHACIGTPDGQILACFVMQPAEECAQDSRLLRWIARAVVPHTNYLGELDRPLFPAERESFGPRVFTSLPALQKTPLQHVVELNCLMRNQAIPDSLTSVAAIEAVCIMMHILLMPERDIHAIVGCINQEARGLLAKLGIPILYASAAPVIHDNLPPYWSRNMNDSGKFWPFAVAQADFRANPNYVSHFNEVLELPPEELLQAVAQFRRSGQVIVPAAVRPTWSTPPYCWSDDPFHPLPASVPDTVTAVTPPLDAVAVTISAQPSQQTVQIPGMGIAIHSD